MLSFDKHHPTKKLGVFSSPRNICFGDVKHIPNIRDIYQPLFCVGGVLCHDDQMHPLVMTKTNNWFKSPCFMGKSIISMAIFRYLSHYQRVLVWRSGSQHQKVMESGQPLPIEFFANWDKSWRVSTIRPHKMQDLYRPHINCQVSTLSMCRTLLSPKTDMFIDFLVIKHRLDP